MADWMNNHVETNIQAALQSQSIQTVLEKNSTTLSDGAFQSFLTNAPIPRVFLAATTTQAIPSATFTTLNWGQATRVHDPYQMQPIINTAIIQIPVAGYYNFACQTQFNINGNYAGRQMLWTTLQSKRLGAGLQLAQGAWDSGGTNLGNMNMSVLLPFDAGDSFFIQVLHNGGAAITTGGAQLTWIGGVWNAPYNQYNQSGGAQ